MIFEDLRIRHSVRTFSSEALDANQIRTLNAVITDINTHQNGMYFQLVTNSPKALGGLTAGYGIFKNANNYIACVVDKSYAHYIERGGYFGMQILMRAFTLGLGTCFVSGTYSAKNVDARVRPGEELLFIIAIGKECEESRSTFMASLIHKISHRRRGLTPMEFLDTNLPWEKICAEYPLLLKGLEGVALAPSAMNRQPVGILIKKVSDPYNPLDISKKNSKKAQRQQELSEKYDKLLHSASAPQSSDDNIVNSEYLLQAYVPTNKHNELLDLGIAMFCFQMGYPGEWKWGNPATFIPDIS